MANKELIKKKRKRYYNRNAEIIKERNRIYYKKNARKVKERVKKYKRENPLVIKKATAKWRKNYPYKFNAEEIIRQKIKFKQIPPAKDLKCLDCGDNAKQYHHEDYYKPEEVIPLCIDCHAKRHNK